jgi:hypothetical protein
LSFFFTALQLQPARCRDDLNVRIGGEKGNNAFTDLAFGMRNFLSEVMHATEVTQE